MPISATLRELITKRDKSRCAYCQTSEDNCGLRMHIDHIIPEAVGGSSTPNNLCLICFGGWHPPL
ncbi:MAG TPA: HNH endonuclease [Caldilineaceae bacterium]|nr:HNH endonuclease [Caldilineaceae bacterium]